MSRIIINEFEIVPTEGPPPREKQTMNTEPPPPTPEEIREVLTRHLRRVKRVLAD